MDVKLDSLQTVIIALTCLVPGFILHSTYSFFAVRRNETKELLFLRFIAFTAINFIVCLSWVRHVLAPNFIRDHPWKTEDYLVWIIFACPVVIGLLIAVIDRLQLLRTIIRLFGLQPMHSTPTAWDYCFNQLAQRGPRFVIVTLKDGKQVGGLFAGSAVASSDSSERDIYLIAAHSLARDREGNLVKDAEGNIKWALQPQNDGILIIGGEIRSLEFLHPLTVPETNRWVFFNQLCHSVKVIKQKLRGAW